MRSKTPRFEERFEKRMEEKRERTDKSEKWCKNEIEMRVEPPCDILSWTTKRFVMKWKRKGQKRWEIEWESERVRATETREKLKRERDGKNWKLSRRESRETAVILRDNIGSHGLKYVERGWEEIKNRVNMWYWAPFGRLWASWASSSSLGQEGWKER